MKAGQKIKDFYGATGFVIEVRGESVLTTIDRSVWYHVTKLI